MTDEEWAFFRCYVEREGRGRPPSDHRRLLDAIFFVALTGRTWRRLPPELGKWQAAYRQFRRWTKLGLWDAVLDDLERTATKDAAWQIRANRAYDSVGAWQQLREKVVAARELVHRPKRARKGWETPSPRR